MESWTVAGFAWFEADKEVDWRLAVGLEPEVIDFLRTRPAKRAVNVLGPLPGVMK